MKRILLFLIAINMCLISFAQIGFEKKVILDGSEWLMNTKSVQAVDIDNDGDNDIVSSGGDGKLVWFENLDGLGNFSDFKVIYDFSSDGYVNSLYVVDIDGDNDKDIVVGLLVSNNLVWFENLDGLGNFSDEIIIDADLANVKSIYTSDLDGDGDQDVLLGSQGVGHIAWYENTNGLGDFGEKQDLTDFHTSANYVYASDLDGDGDMDVLGARGYSFTVSNIVWFENLDGQGSFSEEQMVVDDSGSAKKVTAADVDGDGDQDVLFTFTTSAVRWSENLDGLGNFGSSQFIYQTGSTFCVEDIDSDGDIDILSNYNWNFERISWNENINGTGSFDNAQIIQEDIGLNEVFDLYASDLDGDGNLEVIVAMSNKLMWFKNNNGQNTFEEERILDVSAHDFNEVFAVDLDGDLDKDILCGSEVNNIHWLENLGGQENFGPKQYLASDGFGEVFFPSDLNGDGAIDVIIGDEEIYWLENQNASFDVKNVVAPSGGDNFVRTLSAGDIDGDGDEDIIAAIDNLSSVAWYENLDGLGSFSSAQEITIMGSGVTKLFVIDVDVDGDNDVLVYNTWEDKIAWYENTDGMGDFSNEHIVYSAQVLSLNKIHPCDFDNDGDLDILLAGTTDGELSFFKNNISTGNGFGQRITFENLSSTTSSIHAADIDNDGDLDVVSTNVNDYGVLYWFENTNGLGYFGDRQIIEYSSENPIAVISADIDLNGRTDLITIGDDILAVYDNLGVLGNEINGNVKFDSDLDDCSDLDDGISGLLVKSNNGNNNFATFTLENGSYEMPVNEGEFTTSMAQFSGYFVSNPESQISNFSGLGNSDTVDFCIQSIGVFNDVQVSVYPLGEARPGFDASYQLILNNVGTTVLSGTLGFEYNESKLQFINASEATSSQTANTLVFDYIDLSPFETRTIDLNFNVFAPPTTEINDELEFIATINPVSGDETEEDNVFVLNQTVVGSYDPNDIHVLEGDQILFEDVDKYLHYIIRFQNTGTASAVNVRVEHILSDKLDWTTMQLESMSHEGRVEIVDGSEVSFIFNNIYLPDSTNDEPNSHGYIAFKIKPKNDVVVGDIINAVADIYFDFNPPINTNTEMTEIVETLSLNEFTSEEYWIYPNPVSSILTVKSNQDFDSIRVIDLNGRVVVGQQLDALYKSYEINLDSLNTGMYFIEVGSNVTTSTMKFMKQ